MENQFLFIYNLFIMNNNSIYAFNILVQHAKNKSRAKDLLDNK